MLKSARVSAAKMKGLYTSWVSWNTLPGGTGALLSLGVPIWNPRDWTGSPGYLLPHLPLCHLTSPFLSPPHSRSHSRT